MAVSIDTEKLFKVMQETHKIKEEVSVIKSCLERHEYEDDEILIPLLLTRLSSLAPCVEIIKATEVEKAVNIFKNHSSKTIRDHVQSLMNEWKNLKEEWQKFTGQSLSDEYATDDDKEDSQRRADQKLKTKKQSQGVGKELRVLNEVHKPDNHLSFKEGPRIILKLRSNQKVCEKSKSIIPIRKEAENITTKKAIMTEKPEATYSSDLKFKSTQKRLHESYKQAENAKKQRRIQVIDYLPKERSCYAKKNHLTHEKSFRPHVIRQH